MNMKLSVMTLGCPAWDLETILNRAKAYGYDGIDFRGLMDTVDISTLPAFTTDLSKTAKRIRDSGLEVSGVSTSISVCDPDKAAANIEEAKRNIPVALGLGAKNIRIFGGGPVPTIGHAKAAEIGRGQIEALLELDGADQLNWNFETHDHWTRSADAKLLLDSIPAKNFGACWDIGHTSRVSGESPEQTWDAIGPRVNYLHVKDAMHDTAHPHAMKDGWRYVIPGTGQLPLAPAVQMLKQIGFDGWLLFEHEKRWQKELDEPEVIFPAFIQWAKPLI